MLFQGAIVGYRTGKLLHIEVKNKYCLKCSLGTDENHKCHKNWANHKSSSGMEAAAIVEGFKNSISQHKLRYMRLVADGDANVYHSIIVSKPYGEKMVQKIECTNHLMRNFCRRLKKIVDLGKFDDIYLMMM